MMGYRYFKKNGYRIVKEITAEEYLKMSEAIERAEKATTIIQDYAGVWTCADMLKKNIVSIVGDINCLARIEGLGLKIQVLLTDE